METGHQHSEVCPYPRHRGGRQDHPARHLLPDARQLLLRRLLQEGGHLLRLGAGHHPAGPGRFRLRPGVDLGHRARPRLPPRLPRGGHRGQGDLAEGRRRRGPHPGPQPQGQLLAHGHPGPWWPLLGDLHRPRPRVRPGGWPGGRRGPLPGDLEPGLRDRGSLGGARQGRFRHRRAAQEPQHRHRRWPGANRPAAAGSRQHVRDRPGVPGDRQGRGAVGQALRRRPCR